MAKQSSTAAPIPPTPFDFKITGVTLSAVPGSTAVTSPIKVELMPTTEIATSWEFEVEAQQTVGGLIVKLPVTVIPQSILANTWNALLSVTPVDSSDIKVTVSVRKKRSVSAVPPA